MSMVVFIDLTLLVVARGVVEGHHDLSRCQRVWKYDGVEREMRRERSREIDAQLANNRAEIDRGVAMRVVRALE